MSWQTPLWTCGRADWVAAYDDVSDTPHVADTPAAAKPDLAAADESTARKSPTLEPASA